MPGVRVRVAVENLEFVLTQFDQIRIKRGTAAAGPFVLVGTLTLEEEEEVYYFTDPTGDATLFYVSSFFNSTTLDESADSPPLQGGEEVEKIGYSFNNYSAPPGAWGEVLTADDMRFTYLFGIDTVAQDINETEWEDSQFKFVVETALEDFEKFLTIDIRRKKYLTSPADTLIQSRRWREGVDYTDEDDPYDFDPLDWQNFGFIQLRHYPVIKIDRAVLFSQVKTEVIDLKGQNWVRIDKATGQVRLFPKEGLSFGPFAIGALPWRLLGYRFPEGYEFDYETGYKSSDFVPEDLRDVIGKYASIKALASIGDGLLAGFSSQSVSLDGLSESFSSTQSATSAFFGARIKQYQDDVKDWLSRNRYKYGAIPIAFTGA